MTPSIYVGTYAKYNAGNFYGAWLDLEDYSDKDEFLQACYELHNDEDDPELMFQDWQDIPAGMVDESHIDDEVWEWLELDDDDKELLTVYREYIDGKGTLEQARDSFLGKADSKAEFAEQYYDDCGLLGECPEQLRYYIDWHAVAHDMEYDLTFAYVDGEYWVFDR